MRQTKKVTVSALTVALSVVVMLIGFFFSVVDLTACALASLLVAFIYIEIGSPYTFLVWLCTSLTTAICFPGSVIWVEYLLIFGIYPILKAYIERLPRWVWWIPKLAYINAIIWLLALAMKLLGLEALFNGETVFINIALYVLMNIAFVAYDLFLTVLIRFYLVKLQPRFKNLLK